MRSDLRSLASRGLWRAVRLLHHLDFAFVLPGLARLPISVGHRLAALRGQLNAATGRDWRSVALGFRHIRAQSALGYRALPGPPQEADVQRWCRERFVAEARDEYEARLVAANRVPELQCDVMPSNALQQLQHRQRGLVLLTPHFESFVLGLPFLARSGVKINVMSSAVTHDPRVDQAVQRHFTAKYRAIERHLNGGTIVDLEQGTRQFYRMLQANEILVILGDAPAPPGGAEMEVDFLGAKRVLSGGPLRLAQRTNSDLGCYLCRHLGGTNYQLELGPIGPSHEPAAVQAVYNFFSSAILKNPGGWWGADLLVNMPKVKGAAPVTEAAPPVSQHATLALIDSPLSGSDELALGLGQLRARLEGAGDGGWREASSAQVTPSAFLAQCTAPRLLVLLDPALIATQNLLSNLGHCLAQGAACAVSSDQRTATGDWAISYTSLVDFERYVERRQSLPACGPWNGSEPYAYMVDVKEARTLMETQPALGWSDLPRAFGSRTVESSHAFVHSYANYQQGARLEMLDMLPSSVKRLLDVGGGEGHFARAFIERRGGEAWLVEPSAAADKAVRVAGLNVIKGRLEEADPERSGLFDAVSFLDVLEHMTDPGAALRTARKFLRPDGHLLVSVPNVGHWSVVRDLALGRFDYMPVGILCGTHLRFFTAQSLEQLLKEAGFTVVEWRRAGQPMPDEFGRFLSASTQVGLTFDRESLETESLHVLATLH